MDDYTGGVSEIFVVNASTQYKDAAVTTLKFLSEDMSRELYLAGVGLPTWKLNGVDNSKIDPLTKSLLSMTSSAKSYTLWWNTYLEGANSELDLKTSEPVRIEINSEAVCKRSSNYELQVICRGTRNLNRFRVPLLIGFIIINSSLNTGSLGDQ